ncbi:MAG: hypothetical protein CMO81_06695 [Waddliaceae bacterium]|nr:hypothetical protein [Waddliaceae bacterium]
MDLYGELYTYSSGGNGHKEIATVLRNRTINSHEQSLSQEKIDQYYPMIDTMYALGKTLGDSSKNLWNYTLKKDATDEQERLFAYQGLADRVTFLPLFRQVYQQLFNMPLKPRAIINTQVIGTKAIVLAARFYNHFRDKKFPAVKVEIWLTDFPERATHYLDPIRKLSTKDKNVLEIYTPKPALKNEMTDVAKYCGLPKKQVHYLDANELPVNPLYHDPHLRQYSKGSECTLNIKVPHEQMKYLKTIPYLKFSPTDEKEIYSYPVKKDEIVYQCSLGSYPKQSTVLCFVKALVALSRIAPEGKTIHAFILCGKDSEESNSLFHQVCQTLNTQKYSPRLRIVPLPFQRVSDIAITSARADKDFTGNGGASTFQQKALSANLTSSRGKPILLSHTTDLNLKELDKKSLERTLIEQIKLWEAGNVEHLIRSIDAEITAPSLFLELFSKDFDLDSPALPVPEIKKNKRSINTKCCSVSLPSLFSL